MKKILTTLACGIILASTANADVTRVEMGVGSWVNSPSGSITSSAGTDTSDEELQAKGYFWLLLKHPLAPLPNVRVEYSNVLNNGVASGTFKKFVATSATKTSLEIEQFDIIPYYNVLDNTPWITIDLGLDIRMIKADYSASQTTAGNYSESATTFLPLAYARARMEIPSTDFGIEVDGKYVTYSSNTMYDVRAKVDYTLDLLPAVNPAIELGYRIQKIKTDESVDLNMDMKFSGVYAGLMLRF
jgi:outer membrane protein